MLSTLDPSFKKRSIVLPFHCPSAHSAFAAAGVPVAVSADASGAPGASDVPKSSSYILLTSRTRSPIDAALGIRTANSTASRRAPRSPRPLPLPLPRPSPPPNWSTTVTWNVRRLGEGSGNDRYMNGSNLTDVYPQSGHVSVDLYSPWNVSTTTESFRAR